MAKKYELTDANTTLWALNLSSPTFRVISHNYNRVKITNINTVVLVNKGKNMHIFLISKLIKNMVLVLFVELIAHSVWMRP